MHQLGFYLSLSKALCSLEYDFTSRRFTIYIKEQYIKDV